MIESFHYRERERTRLSETANTSGMQKVLYRSEKKRVQFSSEPRVRASKRIETDALSLRTHSGRAIVDWVGVG